MMRMLVRVTAVSVLAGCLFVLSGEPAEAGHGPYYAGPAYYAGPPVVYYEAAPVLPPVRVYRPVVPYYAPGPVYRGDVVVDYGPISGEIKHRYRYRTPYGTHKYDYEYNPWTGEYEYEYDFDD